MEISESATDFLAKFVENFDRRAPYNVMGALYAGWNHGGPAPTQG